MAGIKGVILAGGEGKRFRPLTYYFQKCMIPVGPEQRPILEYIVRLFEHHGLRDLVLLVGYKHQQIANYFDGGARFGVRMEYVLDDPNLKGSANALVNAYRRGTLSREDTLVVYFGDILSNIDLGEMVERHAGSGAAATVALSSGFKVRVGTAEVEGGRVTGFEEKPQLRQPVSIGVLAMSGWVLGEMDRLLEEGGFEVFDIMGDVVPYLLKRGHQVSAYVTDSFWYDLGSVERYERLGNDEVSEKLGFLFEGR